VIPEVVRFLKRYTDIQKIYKNNYYNNQRLRKLEIISCIKFVLCIKQDMIIETMKNIIRIKITLYSYENKRYKQL